MIEIGVVGLQCMLGHLQHAANGQAGEGKHELDGRVSKSGGDRVPIGCPAETHNCRLLVQLLTVYSVSKRVRREWARTGVVERDVIEARDDEIGSNEPVLGTQDDLRIAEALGIGVSGVAAT